MNDESQPTAHVSIEEPSADPAPAPEQQIVNFDLAAGWRDVEPNHREVYISIKCPDAHVLDVVTMTLGTQIHLWMNQLASNMSVKPDVQAQASTADCEDCKDREEACNPCTCEHPEVSAPVEAPADV